jgi:hypothetical protein
MFEFPGSGVGPLQELLVKCVEIESSLMASLGRSMDGRLLD